MGPLGEFLCKETNFVAGDLAALVLFVSVDEAGPEDLCARWHPAAVDGERHCTCFKET